MNKQPIAIDTYCVETLQAYKRLQVNFYIDPNRFEEETVTSKRKTLYFTESIDTLLDGMRGKLEQYCHDNGITVDSKTKFNITQINKTSIDFTVTYNIRKSYVDLLLDALKNLEV